MADPRRALRRWLPVGFALGAGGPATRRVVTVAMQRSGQHLVIDWLCRGVGRAVHLNFCWPHRRGARLVLLPQNGRHVAYADGVGAEAFERAQAWDPVAFADADLHLYSVEDYDTADPVLRRALGRSDATVLILRDPYNWLASSLRHGRSDEGRLRRKVGFLKGALRRAVAGDPAFDRVVDFNRFVAEPGYRAALAGALGLTAPDRAERALGEVPAFGGGSSFDGRARPTPEALEGRWRRAADAPLFREVAADRELLALAEAFFGPRPVFADVRAAFDLPSP